MSPDDEQNVREALIRLEAKVDVVITKHDGELRESRRRLDEHEIDFREVSLSLNRNSLAINTMSSDITQLKASNAKRTATWAAWGAVAVAMCAAIIEPILNALIK